ncbi:MAG: LysM peptidoglycan-binding domain-containing protein [Candidatus Omnitrophota bacterium]
MRRYKAIQLIVLALVLILAGCTVRTYPVVKDRVDQDLSSSAGNRGYIMGQPPAGEEKQRSTTRTMRVFEIELGSPVKIEKRAKPLYEEESPAAGTAQGIFQDTLGDVSETAGSEVVSEQYFENYTVQKGDTLQKISQKYFGTTKKWKKIFEANTDKLKGPDKIRLGQVIRIPLEKLKEPSENLK